MGKRKIFKNRVPERLDRSRKDPVGIANTIEMLRALEKVSELEKQDF